jgi:hypothetical protein
MAQYKHLPIYKTTYNLLECMVGAWFNAKLTKMVLRKRKLCTYN